jgi:uncharacterized Zn-finger protein
MSKVDAQPITVTAQEMPAFCPNPKMPVWSSHPKVYLSFDGEGQAACPYCGTAYQLDGPVKHH